jgi:hypothetical protein
MVRPHNEWNQLGQSCKKDIKLIRNFLNMMELIALVMPRFYSILLYNSEVWHVPSLTQDLKHCLLVASSLALKMCLRCPDSSISYLDLHKMIKRATFETPLMLYKTFSDKIPEDGWLHLNMNVINTTKLRLLLTKRDHSLKIGWNCAAQVFLIVMPPVCLQIWEVALIFISITAVIIMWSLNSGFAPYIFVITAGLEQ